MFGETYQHDTIRKYSVIFGALFNDINVNRIDGGGDIAQTLKVPLGYGPKEKMLTRVFSNPDGLHIGDPAIQLPRMSFQMMDMSYDSSRKLTSATRINRPSVANNDIILATYNPVPYNFNYKLWVVVKSATDGTRIVEQIVPYFKPQYTVSATIVPEMGLSHDIPIVLNSCTLRDEYEGSYEQRRYLEWELDFTLKGYLYAAVNTSGLIKLAQTSIYTSFSNTSSQAIIQVQPGLTANGEPTTDIDETIPYADINEEDDWAYIVQIDEVYE
jgi:hypothetical protein